jgi:hypothetical protein
MNMNQFSSTSQTIFSRKKKNESRREKEKNLNKWSCVMNWMLSRSKLACVIITTTTTKYTHTQQRAHLDDEREKIKQNKSRRNT